jgi:outer membrane protein
LSLINVSNWKNIQSANLGIKAASFQLKDRELNMVEQAATTYYFTLLSYEAVRLSQELVSASDSLLDAAEARLKNGMIEPMEYNRVRAIYLENLQQLRASEGAVMKNMNSLKALSGLNPADSILLSENFLETISSPEHPAELSIKNTALPRYNMLVHKKLQADQDFKRQQSRVLPEISIFGRYMKQTFGNQFDTFTKFNTWYNIGVVGVRADWILFSGFNRQSSIRQTSLQSQAAQKELENYSLQSAKELEELTINHQVSGHALARSIEHYKLNHENYGIAGVKYTQGVYSIDQYITIYQEHVRSQNQYLNNLANYLVYESIINTRNILSK